jgi:hypothetical protein
MSVFFFLGLALVCFIVQAFKPLILAKSRIDFSALGFAFLVSSLWAYIVF